MKIIQLELFTFDELSDDAKQKAIENERNNDCLNYYWYTNETEHFKDCLALIGFNNADISFSGFYSKGDGASFTADYDSSLINLDELKRNDTRLYDLMARKDSIFGASGLTSDNRIAATVKRISHHYSHNNTVSIENIEINGCGWGDYDSEDGKHNKAFEAVGNYLTSLKDDLCHIIYSRLEAEYEHQTSDEYIAETLDINEYYFLADGTFCHQTN